MILLKKSALVTGGTRGIGAACGIALAEQGANVALAARRIDDEANRARQKIEQLGRECLLIQADVSRADEAASAVQQTIQRFGGLDVLVHSAGGPVNGGLFELTPEAWHAAFDVHLHAIFHLCRAAIPGM